MKNHNFILGPCGRKTVTCSICMEVKTHYGLGMCSACLRTHKRQTKPSFYLGTCYSEMSRRVKTRDPLRPVYFGLEICSKADFITKFETDINFLSQYKDWQQSGFQRRSSPSIDRVDNEKGYTIDNLAFIRHGENSCKDKKVRTKLVNVITGEEFFFNTATEAGKFINTGCTKISKSRKTGRPIKGYIAYEAS